MYVVVRLQAALRWTAAHPLEFVAPLYYGWGFSDSLLCILAKPVSDVGERMQDEAVRIKHKDQTLEGGRKCEGLIGVQQVFIGVEVNVLTRNRCASKCLRKTGQEALPAFYWSRRFRNAHCPESS